MAVTCMDCCKIFWAIFFPPLAVLLEKGCGCTLCINICLTILGWIPGQIHAFCVICHCCEDKEVVEHHHHHHTTTVVTEPAPAPPATTTEVIEVSK